MKEKETLKSLREEISKTDSKLRKHLLKRKAIVSRIGKWKKENSVPVTDEAREKEVLYGQLSGCSDSGEKLLVRRVYHSVFDASKAIESGPNIYLTGMMGCGKSSIGKMLAEKTGRPFLDLDEEIEKDIGMSIAEFFDQNGEKAFREAETKTLLKCGEEGGQVIACGGGAVLASRNYLAMQKTGIIVYIDRDISLILETLDCEKRPLLKEGKSAAEAIFKSREPVYRETADIIISNCGDLESCVNILISKLN